MSEKSLMEKIEIFEEKLRVFRDDLGDDFIDSSIESYYSFIEMQLSKIEVRHEDGVLFHLWDDGEISSLDLDFLGNNGYRKMSLMKLIVEAQDLFVL